MRPSFLPPSSASNPDHDLCGYSHGTQLETLSKIRSAFPQWAPSQTTGGNASQNSDGAALVLLMRRSKAEELGLKILAKYVTTSVVGVPPRVMGIGPSVAIPAVLESVGIKKEDVDLFEVRFLRSQLARFGVGNGLNRTRCARSMADKRSIRINVRLLRQDTRPRPGKSKRERRSDCVGTSVRYVSFPFSSRFLSWFEWAKLTMWMDGWMMVDATYIRATGARQIATGLAELERRKGKVRFRLLPSSPFFRLFDKSGIDLLGSFV